MRRLLDSDFTIRSLLVAHEHLAAVSAALNHDHDVLVVDRQAIEQIVGFNFHRGMLGCALRKPKLSLRKIASEAQASLTLAVCPDVQDPENLGAILRIASALGVHAVVLGPGCCDPFSRRVLRVSMGAALRVKIVECDDLPADLHALRDKTGVELWAAVTDAAAASFDTLRATGAPGPFVGLRRPRAVGRVDRSLRPERDHPNGAARRLAERRRGGRDFALSPDAIAGPIRASLRSFVHSRLATAGSTGCERRNRRYSSIWPLDLSARKSPRKCPRRRPTLESS